MWLALGKSERSIVSVLDRCLLHRTSFSKKGSEKSFVFHFFIFLFFLLPVLSLSFFVCLIPMQARSAACSLRYSGISGADAALRAVASSSGRESSSSFSVGTYSSSSTRNHRTRRRRRNRQTQLVANALAEPSAFRPCIDIHKGKVKQIVGSTLSDLDKAR